MSLSLSLPLKRTHTHAHRDTHKDTRNVNTEMCSRSEIVYNYYLLSKHGVSVRSHIKSQFSASLIPSAGAMFNCFLLHVRFCCRKPLEMGTEITDQYERKQQQESTLYSSLQRNEGNVPGAGPDCYQVLALARRRHLCCSSKIRRTVKRNWVILVDVTSLAESLD